jgi:hypothetical protein
MIGPSSSSSSVAPPDVDIVHYGDDHDNCDNVNAAGRTIDAPVSVHDRRSSRSSAGMRPRRTERPLMRTSTISPSLHSSSYTSSYEHASHNDDFVTFVEFPADEDDDNDDVNSFPSSYLTSRRVGSDEVANSVNTTTTTPIASRKYDDNVGRMFESAALALCRHSGDGVDQSRASLSSSPSLTTTLMGGCSWGELSNVAWSYATRGLRGTPGGGR